MFQALLDVRFHPHASPAFRGVDENGEDEREPARFGCEPWNDLRAAPALAEEPLQEIRRADVPAVEEGELERREAFFEILLETLHRSRERIAIFRDDRSQPAEPILICRRGEGLENELFQRRPREMRQFREDVPHLVHLTALHEGRGQLLPQGFPDTGIAVDDREQRTFQPAALHVLQKRLPADRALLVPNRQMQQHLVAVPRHPVGAQHRDGSVHHASRSRPLPRSSSEYALNNSCPQPSKPRSTDKRPV